MKKAEENQVIEWLQSDKEAVLLPEEKEGRIKKIMAYYKPERLRRRNLGFLWDQLGFIKKRTWCLQLLLFALIAGNFCTAELHGGSFYGEKGIFQGAALLSPLLIIISIGEIARIYNKSMLEIEYATRYSLEKVIMTRLSILGAADCLLLFLLVLFIKSNFAVSGIRLLLYGFVPFLWMSVCCLKSMEYLNGSRWMYFCLGLAALSILFLGSGRLPFLALFEERFRVIWEAAGVVLAAAFIYEGRRLKKQLLQFEKVFI